MKERDSSDLTASPVSTQKAELRIRQVGLSVGGRDVGEYRCKEGSNDLHNRMP